jgi:hypothetical protein
VRSILLGLALAAGCTSAPPPAPAESEDAQARHAADAFLRCYERDGAECRAAEAPVREWAALHTLALVAEAIPTRILDELGPALESLQDDTRVRRVLIERLAEHSAAARLGGCQASRTEGTGERARKIIASAVARLARFGLADTQAGVTVAGLAHAAERAATARVVETRCSGRAEPLYLVLANVGEREWLLVDLDATPPEWLHPPPEGPASAAPLRIDPPAPNLVDPWLPIYEEQL